MITELQPNKMNDEELRNWLINAHEKYYIEMKKAQELQGPSGSHILHSATQKVVGSYWD